MIEKEYSISKRLYSIKDASIILGRSPWTIAEMVRTGRLPYIADGKRKMLDIRDIEAYITKNRVIASD
jgi:hypothetical protein